jgi:hypothetical protein
MSFIDDLTAAQIQNDPLPIRELLINSYYYPASGFDGQFVKHAPNTVQSFVYCDFAQGEQALMERYERFRGYTPVALRSVQKEELIPNGWQMQIPPGVNREQYMRYFEQLQPPFAKWIVYQRDENQGAHHGPERFSLLYIGGEGVATYQALYWTNRATPAGLGIIQPGTGWGFNWTDFASHNGALAWVTLQNPYGTPQFIYYGGYGDNYEDLNWPRYVYANTVAPYYAQGVGKATVWKRQID